MTIRRTLSAGAVLASLLAVPAAVSAAAGAAQPAQVAVPVAVTVAARDGGTCPSKRSTSRCIRHHRGYSAASYGLGPDRYRPPKPTPGIHGDDGAPGQPGGPGGPGGIND
ncbi:hypothetical protein [Streptosporangium pseudovulgare]|uniref:Uncharacterized protein n=1 Tax=Streptosporangium pseudovulgare TaxID=35765 RepID=A0ABQ2QR85_9ACTN|nr:hypothetical protein [Streptosporangium pseudovulgare]GGP88802.1 hypothetical protein GCM10010140_18210 [Streptosporangium pseudovulgare]